MKRLFGVSIVFMLGFLALSIMGAATLTEVLTRLGIDSEDAQDHIWNSISHGYLSYPNASLLKAVPVGERAEIIGTIGILARTYTSSADFARRYAEHRNGQRPDAPEPPQTMDEQRLAQKAELEASLKESEESIKSMPAELREAMEPVVEMLREQIKQLDDPDNPMFNDEMAGYQQQAYEEQLRDHQQALAEWELEYPEKPAEFLKRRLREFLQETEAIDFAAELKPGPEGKRVFVNPAYEQKSSNWKLAYRAGRETIEAARSVAQEWLQELEHSQ